MFNVVYMCRRLYFSAVATFFDSYPGIQVQLLTLHSVLVLSYVSFVRPFELPLLNFMEVINEASILAATYHLFFFTDYVDDPELQYTIGWSILGVTVFNIAVNMLVMFTTSLRKVWLLYRKLKHKFLTRNA